MSVELDEPKLFFNDRFKNEVVPDMSSRAAAQYDEESKLISSYVEGEKRARQVLDHAKGQVDNSNIPKRLKAVNKELDEVFEAEVEEGYDTIELAIPGVGTRYLKRHQKRTANRVSPEALARAFDLITEAQMQLIAAKHPDGSPVEWLLECLLAKLNDDGCLWSVSTRMELEERPVTKKAAAGGGTEIRIATASARVLALARMQLELREHKKRADAYMRDRRAAADAHRKRASEAELHAILERRKQSGYRVHYEGVGGERTSLSKTAKKVAAKPITVPMLAKGGMLAEILNGCVDPTVYGSAASDIPSYLTPGVRDQIVAAFHCRAEKHKRDNARTTPSLRVHTLPRPNR
jgi:hypothetical protein